MIVHTSHATKTAKSSLYVLMSLQFFNKNYTIQFSLAKILYCNTQHHLRR